MRKLFALIGLVIIFAACEAQSTAPPPTTQAPPTLSASDGLDDPPAGPALELGEPALADGIITISRVVSNGPSWVVIYADEGGEPGPIIAQRPVFPGEMTDITVEIDPALATDTLYAIMHVDLPEVRTFDYPDGDPRVSDAEGNPIIIPISVSSE